MEGWRGVRVGEPAQARRAVLALTTKSYILSLKNSIAQIRSSSLSSAEWQDAHRDLSATISQHSWGSRCSMGVLSGVGHRCRLIESGGFKALGWLTGRRVEQQVVGRNEL